MKVQIHDSSAAKPPSTTRETPSKTIASSNTEELFDLRDLLGLLRRRMRLIISTIAVVLAIAGCVIMAITPIYSASTLILYDPQRKSLLDPTAHAGANPADSSSRVESEVEILRSDGLLLQVIRSASLVVDPEFGVRPGMRDRIAALLGLSDAGEPSEQESLGRGLNRLKESISVQRLGATYVISVTARSSDPEKAAELANTLATAYLGQQVALKVQGLPNERDAIREQAQAFRHIQRPAEEAGTFIRTSDPPASVITGFKEVRPRTASTTGQYERLLARQEALDLEASLQLASSMIVSEAIAPTRASSPNTGLIVGVAGLLALGMGLGLAVVSENYSGGFTRAEQLQAVTRKRVGAVVPRQQMESGSYSLADIVVSTPLSRYAESIRRLRAMLHTVLQKPLNNESAEATRGAVIMVSSALPNEGKTTVALSLGRAYALSGERVLVLDCDMRNPGIHKQLNVESSTPLVDVVGGAVTHRNLSKVLVNDPKTTLTSIIGGQNGDLPTDQLAASKSLNQIVAAARQSFDYVIIDSPPVESVVDGLYLADHADAIVLVVQWAKTPQRAVTSAINRLDTVARPTAEILVVLNQQEGRVG